MNNELEKPTIFLLHGFPTSSFDYFKLWQQFNNLAQEKRQSLLTFDYLGYGFSDKPLDYEYSLFDMADMCERLLLHLDIRRVTIIAHDVGDSVAQELIRRDNLKSIHFTIEKCALLNGGIFYNDYVPVISQNILRTPYLGTIFGSYLFKYPPFRYSFSKIFGQMKNPTPEELYDMFLTIRYNQGNKVLVKTIGYLNDRKSYGDVWIDALNETSHQVLFIYGPADPINRQETFIKNMITNLPKVRLNVLSHLVGHYPQIEDSFTVFEILKKFIY